MGLLPEWVRIRRRLLFLGGLGKRREDPQEVRSLGVSHHADGEARAGYGKRGSRGNSQTSQWPRSIVPPFLPRAAWLPVRRPRDRFLRDLGRRPVLLWTAHSAAVAAAAPGVSPAPPGGE